MNNHSTFIRIKKLTGKSIVAVAAKHNLREIAAEYGADSHIDVSRTQNNYIMRGADTSTGITDAEHKILADTDFPRRLRRDSVRCIEILISLSPNANIDHRAYFVEVVAWIETYYGAPVLSAIVHLDEPAPHCHVLILPLVDGKMVGSDLVGNSKRLQAMHTDFHEQVASKFGLARQKPQSRLSQAVRHDLAAKVVAKIKTSPGKLNEPAVKDALIEAITANPGSIAAALGIDIPQPKKPKARSFVQIMTKPQKQTKPIGFTITNPIGLAPCPQAEKMQTLSCVGLVNNPQLISSTDVEQSNYSRTRDEDQDARYWNSEIGEFIQPPTPKPRTTMPSD